MNKKVIFFDIDGTILTGDCRVPASAVQAIHAAQSNGHLCMVNTGRPYSHIEPLVKRIGFDGYICSCGQHILLNGETLLHTGLSAAVCREIVRLTRQCHLDVVFESEAGIWYDLTRPMRREAVESMEYFAARGFDVGGSIDEEGFRFDKFCVWTNPDSDLPVFLDYINRHCTVIDREGDLLELVVRGCSKETGIRAVMEQTGTDFADSYAIGDSSNDLPMLQCVAHSIAMGNAPEHVKRIAEYVTAPIDRDGLAKALQHYHLT